MPTDLLPSRVRRRPRRPLVGILAAATTGSDSRPPGLLGTTVIGVGAFARRFALSRRA